MAGESRSTTIIGGEQIGRWNDARAGVDGSKAWAGVGCGNSCRASRSRAARFGPARNPKERMRTKPRGSACSRKGRRNSSAETVLFLVLPPEGDRLALEGDETGMGDGDPMRVYRARYGSRWSGPRNGALA